MNFGPKFFIGNPVGEKVVRNVTRTQILDPNYIVLTSSTRETSSDTRFSKLKIHKFSRNSNFQSALKSVCHYKNLCTTSNEEDILQQNTYDSQRSSSMLPMGHFKVSTNRTT